MRYGYFDDEKREYVITQPDTPLPWINYLGGQNYFGLISNTAGGYSFYRDARLRRLTRYRYNNAPLDLGGRCLYLRDDDSRDVPALRRDVPPERLIRIKLTVQNQDRTRVERHLADSFVSQSGTRFADNAE